MTAEWGKITASELVRPVQGKLLLKGRHDPFTGLSTDSRKVKPGDLFWALEGERYDGHDFVGAAVKAGASGIVICEKVLPRLLDVPESEEKEAALTIITVRDTLKALGDLAHWWRRQYKTPVLSITGSAGKTTTKEMTANIFTQTVNVLKSPGNFNNLIGLPLTLLDLGPGTEIVILELGMNHPGEIARLAEICEPDAGLITNVGKAHLEGVGTIGDVAKAKAELIENMPATAIAILNGDDQLLIETAGPLRDKLMTFGLGVDNDVSAEDIEDRGVQGVHFRLRHRGESWPVSLCVPGLHNVMNALGAAAAALAFGVAPDHIRIGLEQFCGIRGRFTVDRLPVGVTIIDDTYNANPASLQAAMEAGKRIIPDTGRFVVALGDMLELGAAAPLEHRDAGRLVAESGAACLVVMGRYAPDLIRGALEADFPEKSISRVETHDQMVRAVVRQVGPGDVVLFKASRMMGLDKVVEGFKTSMEQEGGG